MKYFDFPMLNRGPIEDVVWLIRRSCKICVAHTMEKNYGSSLAARLDGCETVKEEIGRLLRFFIRKGAFETYKYTLRDIIAIDGSVTWTLSICCYTNGALLTKIKNVILFSHSARRWSVT